MQSFFLLSMLVALVVADVSPTGFKVNNITYGGTGCPQGTLNVNVASNGTVLGLAFPSDFTAQIGPNIAVTEQRKNCQLNFDLLFDPGFQFQLFSADFYGYVKLASGATAYVDSLYYYSGSTKQAIQDSTITGPVTGSFTKHSDNLVAVWSPCGTEAMLNVGTSISLSGDATSTSTITIDKANAAFTQLLYLKWQTC